MRDSRHTALAQVLVKHSTRVQPGEIAMINGIGFETYDLAKAAAAEVVRAGGVPILRMEEQDYTRQLVQGSSDEQIKQLGEALLAEMKLAKVYIGIRGARNAFEMSGVDRAKLDSYTRWIVKPVHLEQRVKHTRWCVLRYPNPAMAQLAQTSTEAFEDFYYRVCTLDYSHMSKAIRPLSERLARTDRVRVAAPGTDLRFSIRNIPNIPCTGSHNIPDGELFTAPVRDSVEGTVQFNTPTLLEGRAFDRIFLRFEKGRAVEAHDSAGNSDELNRILDRDDGARYIGEWSLAFHPYILRPMRDILFDEKISGSWHLALGNSYDEAPNGNQSSLHWDLVQIQRADCGGGVIEFDNEVIRRDGLFVLEELQALNPEGFGAAQ